MVREEWIEIAKKRNASHLIIICDTFDWENYPVYVSKNEALEEVKSKYNPDNMQRILEVVEL